MLDLHNLTILISYCIAIDGKGNVSCYSAKTVKRYIGMDVVFSIFSIGEWIRIGAVGVTPGIFNKLVVIFRSLNIGIIIHVSRAVIGRVRIEIR